jgi:hypothetical protein
MCRFSMGMFAFVRLTLLAALAVLSASSLSADIMIGSKREEVIAELGKPFSAARRDTHEILSYPKGVRIELEGNEVSDIKGYIPKGVAPGAIVPTPPTPPKPPAATLAKPPPAQHAVTEPAQPSHPSASTSPAVASNHAAATAKEEPDRDREPETSLGFAIGVAAVMLVAQFLLTFTALKIAFHYHQMDALWSGIFAITGIDVALQTLFAVVLYFQKGEVRLGIAGTGLPGLAMIWSIRHFCLDQRWNRAFGTASAVKIASILLNLGLLALLARFG